MTSDQGEMSMRILIAARRFFAAAALFLGSTPVHAIEIDLKTEAELGLTIATIKGSFVPGDSLKLRAKLATAQVGTVIIVHLDAQGGSLSEAAAIGRFFHRNGIGTVVPPGARCFTPCPIAFVGGYDSTARQKSQLKHSTGAIGFASVSTTYKEGTYSSRQMDAAVSAAQRGILTIADYLIEVEADPDLLTRIYDQIHAGSVHYLSDEDALSMGIPVFDDALGQLIEPMPKARGGS